MIEDHLRNRAAWDAQSDAYQTQHGGQLSRAPLAWGVWSLAESDLQLLGDVAGRDVLEFGCGAAQWSIALTTRGARCTGLDNSAVQLRHAQRAMDAAGTQFPLVHRPAEDTGLTSASFDIVFCDHGALTFAAPERTIPEAARLLRPGGILAFSCEHPLHAAAWSYAENAVTHTLGEPYFGRNRIEDPAGTVSFVRPISTYVALLIESGFSIEKLLEPQPPAGARTTYDVSPYEWACDYPGEIMFRARLR
ncbi:MAG: class I SAM-dependent methyltransferase [Candidatus Velthaea sp.]